MNSQGIMVKYSGDEIPVMFNIEDKLVLENMENGFVRESENGSFYCIPTESVHIHINLKQVDYIKFIYG